MEELPDGGGYVLPPWYEDALVKATQMRNLHKTQGHPVRSWLWEMRLVWLDHLDVIMVPPEP